MKKEAHHIPFILAISFVLFSGCRTQKEADGLQEETAIPVTAARVTVEDVSYFFKQTGSLLAAESVLVKSEAKGKVTQICFKEGTQVKKGQVLVRLADTKIRAELKQLEALIEQHKVRLAHIRKTLQRKRNLLKGEIISDQDYDDLVAQKGIEEALIEQVKANLIIVHENLEDTEIRAPFDSMASERLVFEGDYIAVGDPVVNVVQIDPLKISIRVFAKFKEKLEINTTVHVSVDAFPDQTFPGYIYFISPEVDVATRTFHVKALLPNPEFMLNPGMFANLSLVYEKHAGALVVPWEAIVQLEDRAFLFVIENELVLQVPVTIAKVFDGKAEVTGKLNPGQMVVLEGKFTVSDGDRVAVQSKPANNP